VTPADYARARRLLMRRDPILGAAIKRIGPCGMAERQRTDHMTALVGAIVSQQLSTRAAATIFGRVRALVPDGEPLSAADINALSDAALRGAGLSGQKVGYLRDLCAREGVACFPYYGLAKGFLTGKYRPNKRVDSPRAAGASEYLDERGLRLLATLDDIAAAHHTTVAAVSLAWLLAQPTVVAPIASARSVEQLMELLPAAGLTLSPEDLMRLSAA